MRMLCADYDIKYVLDTFEDHIQQLIFPKQSHMDFNIACALFLATKCENSYPLDEDLWFNSDLFT